MQKLPIILLSLSLLGLNACGGGTGVGIAYTAATVYLTRDGPGGPADTSNMQVPHDSWCYKTLADVECFAVPKENAGNRLINVDPESKRPLSVDEYNKSIPVAP